MAVRSQRFAVGFDYPVYFTRDVFDPAENALLTALARKEPEKRHRVVFVIDDGVAAAQPDLVARIAKFCESAAARVDLACPPVVMQGGEASKNDAEHLKALLDRMEALALDRHACMVVVGGGALLDLVGYAAAITHRGVRVVRLPTTTLAQADSGVGVKNGVNAYGKKNYLGTFAPPFGVIVDQRLLSSVSERDRIAGMAEAVKVALVKDAAFFSWIRENAAELRAGRPELHVLVERSAVLHLNHIATSGDPFELGSARPLDYGHWSAHKLESMTDHRLRHGEAVSIGMALDAIYAESMGIADPGFSKTLCSVLAGLGLPLWDDALRNRALPAGLDEFREHLGGELTITMVKRPGVTEDVHTFDRDALARALDALEVASRG